MRARTTAETLRQVVDSFGLDLHVALPGTIRSYDAESQTAEIELGTQRVIPAADEDEDDDTAETLPILPSVPVIWPSGGGHFIHWPLSAGDTVLVVFCETDLNAWRESGGVADPGVATRHGLSGGVALPGLRTRGNPIGAADGTYGRLGLDGGVVIEFRSGEIRVGGAQALAQSAQVETHLAAIKVALDTIATAAGATHLYDFDLLNTGDPIATSITKGD
jgi:hypothetical protein